MYMNVEYFLDNSINIFDNKLNLYLMIKIRNRKKKRKK